jgi:hypothetical protein
MPFQQGRIVAVKSRLKSTSGRRDAAKTATGTRLVVLPEQNPVMEEAYEYNHVDKGWTVQRGIDISLPGKLIASLLNLPSLHPVMNSQRNVKNLRADNCQWYPKHSQTDG